MNEKERRNEVINNLIARLIQLQNSNIPFEINNSLINHHPYWVSRMEPEGFEWDGERITITIHKPGHTE